MKGFLHRLKFVGSACALMAGVGMGVTAGTAAPALAANGPCYDVTNSQPTPLHFDPSAASRTIKFLNKGHTVTGTCFYVDNPNDNHWYMQVNYIGPDNNRGYGYISVQRLDHRSSHTAKNSR